MGRRSSEVYPMPERRASTARRPVDQADYRAPIIPARTPDRVAVLLPLPLEGAYDYSCPPGMELKPGAIVRVPLGNREVIGAVWDPDAARRSVAASRLKPVAECIDLPGLPESERRFIDWVASYTMAPPGAVLRMAMSVRAAFEPERPRTGYRLAAELPDELEPLERALADRGLRLTPARRRVRDSPGAAPPPKGGSRIAHRESACQWKTLGARCF